jgi:site-specific DNA-cytosine methylase
MDYLLNIHSALPVTQILSSTPIALPEAASMLSAYTKESRSNPSLHPDCELTAHGPKFPQEGNEGTSVMELLRRINRGMAGEKLGSADAILKQIRDRHFKLGSRDDGSRDDGSRDDYIESLKQPATGVTSTDDLQDSRLEPLPEIVKEELAGPSAEKTLSESKKHTRNSLNESQVLRISSTKGRERASAGPESADKFKRKRKRKQDDR